MQALDWKTRPKPIVLHLLLNSQNSYKQNCRQIMQPLTFMLGYTTGL